MVLIAEVGLILLFSIIGGVLAVRFRQPSVLGLILIGALIGPSNLGLIKNTSLINTAIEIGAILLLFTVGIEFSMQRLLNLGFRVFLIAALKLGAVFLTSYYVSILLGFNQITSLYLGVILSITSTVIVIKILEQKGFYKRDEMPLLIAILIIEDIFGVFALTFFSGLNTNVDLRPLNMLTNLVISLSVLIVTYLLLQRILKIIINWLVRYSTEDTIAFTSLGLCGGMSYIAFLLNLSPSAGAFLAGNIVASLPNSKAFEKAIHPFILTFTSLFFFSIGTIVNFSVIWTGMYIVIVLFLVNIFSKFLTIGFGSYVFSNFTGKQAVFSGIAMVSVGEFSLLIAKEAGSVGLGIDLVSITAAVIFLSSIAMSMLLKYHGYLYKLTLNFIPNSVKEDMKLTSNFLNNISWTMLKDKVNIARVRFESRSLFNNITILFVVFAAGFFAWNYFYFYLSGLFNNEIIFILVIILALMLIAYPSYKIVKNSLDLWQDILRFLIKMYPKEIGDEKKILKSMTLLSILFLILIVLPLMIVFLKLKFAYNLITAAITALILIFVLLRSSRLIHRFVYRHKKAVSILSNKYKLVTKKRLSIIKNEENQR